MNAAFADLIAEGIVIVYMDDLIIPSIDSEEGIHKLAKILQVANAYGLNINWKKCQIEHVNYLGFIIKDGTVTPSDEKINVVKHFPTSMSGSTKFFRVN